MTFAMYIGRKIQEDHGMEMKHSYKTGAALLLFCFCSKAQVYSAYYYSEEARKAQDFVALSEDDPGARINLQDGSLSLVYNDISIPVSEHLELTFGRTAGLGGPAGFRSWDLNVPYMVGIYSANEGWNAGAADGRRCSSGNFAPMAAVSTVGKLSGDNWWRGIQIYIPGQGAESLLNIDEGTLVPQVGGNYRGVTNSQARVSCLASIKNGGGEGFSVVTADGIRYFFDWMSREAHDTISGMAGQTFSVWLYLSKYYLLATRVEDRHGNYINFNYDGDPNNYARLNSISSSDGSRIDIEYDGEGKIRFARYDGRTWAYNYERMDPRYEPLVLSEVVNPDGSRWSFSGPIQSLDANMGRGAGLFFQTYCGLPAKVLGTEYVGYTQSNTREPVYVRHPSGRESVYEVEISYTGINQAPGYCVMDTITRSRSTLGVPFAYMHYAVKSRSIRGPGVSNETWAYSYDQSWSFAGASNASDRSRTNVVAPDGAKTVYEFGNDFSNNFGQLLAKTVVQGSRNIRHETYEYMASSDGQQFPDRVGAMPHRATGSLVSNWGNEFAFKNRPLVKSTLNQDGVTYITLYGDFDRFARPRRIESSSTVQ